MTGSNEKNLEKEAFKFKNFILSLIYMDSRQKLELNNNSMLVCHADWFTLSI